MIAELRERNVNLYYCDSMDAKVFISYAADDRDLALDICRRIEQDSITCWIAPRDVAAGEEWPAAIARGIECCKLLLLVFSTYANSSKHVLREVECAVRLGRRILTFRVDDSKPSGSMEYFIAVDQWFDASSSIAEQLQTLPGYIRELLSGHAPRIAGPNEAWIIFEWKGEKYMKYMKYLDFLMDISLDISLNDSEPVTASVANGLTHRFRASPGKNELVVRLRPKGFALRSITVPLYALIPAITKMPIKNVFAIDVLCPSPGTYHVRLTKPFNKGWMLSQS